MPIGPVVRSLREQRGLTQADLADRAKVEPSYLSRLESSSRQKRVDSVRLARIAAALDVTLDEILIAAGVQPSPHPAEEIGSKKLQRLYYSLSPDHQVELLAIAEALHTLYQPIAPRVIGSNPDEEVD
jgi:transcriptional regulator with XRE-family HTH domain